MIHLRIIGGPQARLSSQNIENSHTRFPIFIFSIHLNVINIVELEGSSLIYLVESAELICGFRQLRSAIVHPWVK
jgi:hypothetical protein